MKTDVNFKEQWQLFCAQVEATGKEDARIRAILDLAHHDELREMKNLTECGMDPMSFMFGLQLALQSVAEVMAQVPPEPLKVLITSLASTQGLMTAVLFENEKKETDDAPVAPDLHQA